MSARDVHLVRYMNTPLPGPGDETQVNFLKADPLAGQPEKSSPGLMVHGQSCLGTMRPRAKVEGVHTLQAE